MKLQELWDRIYRHWNHFCFGLFSVLGGLYVWFHQGYLDDPRVTPPPPPAAWERTGFSFADDWWFAVLLVISGLVILYGVLGDYRKLRDWGLIMVSPLYGSIAVVFAVRGLLDLRFNLTWVFATLVLALLIGTGMRSDHRENR